MKKFKQYSFCLCLMAIHFGFGQDIPIYGEWDVDDYEIEIDIQCDCTTEEKAAINKGIYQSIKREFQVLIIDSYLDFQVDDRVKGIMGENEVDGSYQQFDDSITLHLESGDHTMEIVTEDDMRLLRMPIEKSFLANAKGSFNLDKIGQVDFKVTDITIIFSNMFDEPYEDHVDGEWE